MVRIEFMGEITAIRSSRRSDGGYVISVDGKVAFTLSNIMFDKLSLSVGQTIDDILESRIEQAKQFDAARRTALQRLNRRALSRRELEQKLRQKSYETEVIHMVLDDLAEKQLLDDRQYAQMFVDSQLRQKPAGKRLLLAKLRAKGVEAGIADAAADEALQEVDQVEAATELARKKLSTLSRYDLATKQRRLWSMLARRGFDGDVIKQVMAGLDLTSETDSD